MELELLPDGRLRIGDTLLDAAGTNDLLQALGEIRSKMDSSIPNVLATTANMPSHFEPATAIGMSTDGSLLIALRHAGFGWLCFDFGLTAAARLRDAIAKHTAGVLVNQLDVSPKDPAEPRH